MLRRSSGPSAAFMLPIFTLSMLCATSLALSACTRVRLQSTKISHQRTVVMTLGSQVGSFQRSNVSNSPLAAREARSAKQHSQDIATEDLRAEGDAAGLRSLLQQKEAKAVKAVEADKTITVRVAVAVEVAQAEEAVDAALKRVGKQKVALERLADEKAAVEAALEAARGEVKARVAASLTAKIAAEVAAQREGEDAQKAAATKLVQAMVAKEGAEERAAELEARLLEIDTSANAASAAAEEIAIAAAAELAAVRAMLASRAGSGLLPEGWGVESLVEETAEAEEPTRALEVTMGEAAVEEVQLYEEAAMEEAEARAVEEVQLQQEAAMEEAEGRAVEEVQLQQEAAMEEAEARAVEEVQLQQEAAMEEAEARAKAATEAKWEKVGRAAIAVEKYLRDNLLGPVVIDVEAEPVTLPSLEPEA